jgi:hypothetical protein
MISKGRKLARAYLDNARFLREDPPRDERLNQDYAME